MFDNNNNTRSLILASSLLGLSACDDGSSTPEGSSRAAMVAPEESIERLHIVAPQGDVGADGPDSLAALKSIEPTMFGGNFPDTRVECSMFVIDSNNAVVANSTEEFDVPKVQQGDLETFDFGIGGAGNGTTATFTVSSFDSETLAVSVSYSFGGSPSALTSFAVALIPKWKLLLPSNAALVNGIVLTPQDAPETVGMFNNITQVSFSCTSLGI